MTNIYVRDSLLIDMTADEQTRGGASTRTDQIGKVFIVVGRDRRCLICDGLFTPLGAAEHAGTMCHPSAGESGFNGAAGDGGNDNGK